MPETTKINTEGSWRTFTQNEPIDFVLGNWSEAAEGNNNFVITFIANATRITAFNIFKTNDSYKLINL